MVTTTRKELAEHLNVTRQTIYRWESEGVLPPATVGVLGIGRSGYWEVPIDELERATKKRRRRKRKQVLEGDDRKGFYVAPADSVHEPGSLSAIAEEGRYQSLIDIDKALE